MFIIREKKKVYLNIYIFDKFLAKLEKVANSIVPYLVHGIFTHV